MERSYAEIKVIYPPQTWHEVFFSEFYVVSAGEVLPVVTVCPPAV